MLHRAPWLNSAVPMGTRTWSPTPPARSPTTTPTRPAPPAGTPLRIHDANGNPPTVFEDYDLYGHKTQIRDPLDNLTRRGYHPDGRLAFIQDPNHQDDSPATNHPGGGFATTASFDAMDR
jgi:hypothetical protein